MKLSTKLWIGFALLLIVSITSCSQYVYHKCVQLHNTSQENIVSYNQLDQEEVSLWDAKYLTFTEKSKVANINKETFITVTEIIMSNRKDGQNLAWKWLTENQPIPYQEFTIFYRDLSEFINTQYMDIFAIEKQKQDIVKRHNLMLRQWPNNLFNRYMSIDEMNYKAGYVSDSTKKLFNIR